jgi:serine/threonine-protein kinase
MSQPAARDSLPQIEKFEILEEIGHGGMATVYRARDVRLGREVAVKIIHRHLRENREVATRFIAEARAAAKLKHPGIVEVYDVSSDEDRERFLVVELVRGVTLRKILQDHREMPAEVGAAIVIELCDAIEHAHASGIIHRDIKPENVLVSLPGDRPAESSSASSEDPAKSGTAAKEGSEAVVSSPSSKTPRSKRGPEVIIKITDFGIAKVLDAQGVTSTGQVLGSPAHMAPEQIEGGDIDPRTDVFALGVILYECTVGHLPFEGKNPAQVLRRVLDGQFAPAERERPAVGARYSAILDRALAIDPTQRLESPAALAALLRDELLGLGIDDPAAEVAAYFRDADAYRNDLKKRLVPRLVARGEEARRQKKVQLAAGDFNRAHALAPDDLVILKRLTQLGRRGETQALLRRLVTLGALSVGLGALAFGIVRAVREEPVELTIDAPVSPEGTISPDALPRPHNAPPMPMTARTSATEEPNPEATGSASARVAATPRIASASPSAAPGEGGEREVRFALNPTSATLEVGSLVRQLGASAKTHVLPVGSHVAKLTPQEGDRASEGPLELPFVVTKPPPDRPNEVLVIPLSLKFKRARVRVVGGPAGGRVACGSISFTVGAEPKEIDMDRPVWHVGCQFGDLDKKLTQAIKAGEDNVIGWPQGG